MRINDLKREVEETKEQLISFKEKNSNISDALVVAVETAKQILGDIKYMTRYRSVYKSLCFACNLGCSVSKSGYSPMTYSPYFSMKKKRKEITEIPKNIIYEQYESDKKN